MKKLRRQPEYIVKGRPPSQIALKTHLNANPVSKSNPKPATRPPQSTLLQRGTLPAPSTPNYPANNPSNYNYPIRTPGPNYNNKKKIKSSKLPKVIPGQTSITKFIKLSSNYPQGPRLHEVPPLDPGEEHSDERSGTDKTVHEV